MKRRKPWSAAVFPALGYFLVACAGPAAAAPAPPYPVTFRASESGALRWPSETETDCPFPDEAAIAHVERALVVIVVLVDKRGYPRRVQVLRDPGFGFAAQASECAMDRRYDHGVGAHGEAVMGWTPPLRLLFVR